MAPSNPISHLKNDSGFSLLEVMIAIIILAFISFSTYKLVDTNTNTKVQVVKEDAKTVQVVTAIGRLDSDISQIYNPLYAFPKQPPQASNDNNIYADAPNPNSSFEGRASNGALIPQFKSEDKSNLVFFTQAHRRRIADTKESRFTWVKYSLRRMEPDPEDDESEKIAGLYELVRQSIPTDVYSTNINWDEAKPQVVMDHIKTLEFSFWDERAKKFTTSIQDLNENKNLIRSLRVEIVWINDAGNEQTVLKSFRVSNPYFNTKLDEMKTNPGMGGMEGLPNDSGGGSVVQ